MGRQETDKGRAKGGGQSRQDRLEEALRANLKRRKEQSRSRGVTPSRGRSDGEGEPPSGSSEARGSGGQGGEVL
jgi:hypothetical protein